MSIAVEGVASRRRGASPLLAGVGLLVGGAIAAAALLPGSRGGEEALLKVSTQGRIQLSNSKRGSAIVSATNLVPGESVRGRVAIGLTGEMPAHLQLAPKLAGGVPGQNGGELADVLQVRVDRPWARRPVNRKALYRGRLATMPKIGLGRVGAQRTRRYRVTVTLPEGGTPPSTTAGDNAYQQSRTELGLVWRARSRYGVSTYGASSGGPSEPGGL